jgi:hypothetical protein
LHQNPQDFSAPPWVYSVTHPPVTSKYSSVSEWDKARSKVPTKVFNYCSCDPMLCTLCLRSHKLKTNTMMY